MPSGAIVFAFERTDDVVLIVDDRNLSGRGPSLGEVLVAVSLGEFIANGPCTSHEVRPHQKNCLEAEK
jgi:hypothetical protein